MNKAILGLTILTLTFAAACKKGTPAGGSWTFIGSVYPVTTCKGIGNSIAASSSTNSNTSYFGGLTIFFPGSSVPTTSGTYTVVDTTPIGSQVNIAATVSGVNDTAYYATGGNGSNQTISLSIASNGTITVTGANIEMLNRTVPGDSAPLSFDIYTEGN